MADAYDPFGLGKRDPERDPANGPAVPNMGGIPATPVSPSANLNPFGIPPSTSPDQGGRPTEGGVAPSPVTATTAPTAPASPARPATEATGEQPAPPTSPATGGVTINVGGAGEKPPTPQGAPSQGAQPQGTPTAGASGSMGTPTQGPIPGLPAPVKLDRLPTAPEMNFAPPGTVFDTHLGAMTRGADGNWNLQPNALGVAKYKEATVREIQKFGSHPFAGDPNAPLPPVQPGQDWFNPFTGTWSS